MTMPDKHTSRYSTETLKTLPDESDWQKAASLSNKAIEAIEADDPDLAGMDDGWLETAEIRIPASKTQLTLRLDEDVVNFFKGQGKGYQTRMNAVLRSYYEAHSERPS